jgi:ACS family hexuronate transporter-like MFS transporter
LLTLLILAGVLNYIDRQLIAVLKPLLQETLRWTDTDYGNLTAVFQLAAAFALLGGGWIVDRVGWRAANPLAVGTWSVAEITHSFARTFAEFIPARIALGATVSLGTPSAIKTIAENFTARNTSVAFGFLNASGNAGAIVTPLIVPAVAIGLGWSGAFFAAGTLGLAWVLAWVLFVRSLPPSLEGLAGAKSVRQAERVSMRKVLVERRTWAIAGGKVFSDSVWWLLLFWAPDFFNRVFHLSMRGFAMPLALMYATAAVGSLLGGVASRRLIIDGMAPVEARKTTMLVCALTVLIVPAALFVQSYWAAALILGVTLAAHQGFSVNLFALASDVTPTSSIATTISIAAFCGNLAGMGILRSAGVLIGRGAGYGLLFSFAAVAYLLALTWIHVVLPRVCPGPQAAPA